MIPTNAPFDDTNTDTSIAMKESFYVGHGENEAMKKEIDHSCVDRLFTMNLNLKFFTPEENFCEASPAPWDGPDFQPCEAVNNEPASFLQPASSQLASASIDVIIMVGDLGSGKSTFWKDYLANAGYEVISQGTLGTWQTYAEKCDESL